MGVCILYYARVCVCVYNGGGIVFALRLSRERCYREEIVMGKVGGQLERVSPKRRAGERGGEWESRGEGRGRC